MRGAACEKCAPTRCTNAPTGGQVLQLTAMEARWKTARELERNSRPAVSRQQVMRNGKEKREENRKITLCTRSEVVKIKYPRTYVQFIYVLTSFMVLRPRFDISLGRLSSDTLILKYLQSTIQGLDLVLWMGVWGKPCHTFPVTCGFLFK
jgi:hypothetical protein